MRALVDGFGCLQLCSGALVSWSVQLAFALLMVFFAFPGLLFLSACGRSGQCSRVANRNILGFLIA